jgi:hypothetical protein
MLALLLTMTQKRRNPYGLRELDYTSAMLPSTNFDVGIKPAALTLESTHSRSRSCLACHLAGKCHLMSIDCWRFDLHTPPF